MVKLSRTLPGFSAEHSLVPSTVREVRRDSSWSPADLLVRPSQFMVDPRALDIGRCFEFYYTCDYFPIIKVTEAGPVVVGTQPYNCRPDVRYIC